MSYYFLDVLTKLTNLEKQHNIIVICEDSVKFNHKKVRDGKYIWQHLKDIKRKCGIPNLPNPSCDG